MMVETNRKPTIRVSCLPFFTAMIVLIVLKISGSITTSWWVIFLAPIGLAWLWTVLVVILFYKSHIFTMHY